MMMITQPQLLALSLNPRDVVYTPSDVARDIVAYFKPSGRILEPCCGDGAFLKYLPPDTEWCEIEKGRDFFAEHRHFDWIVGNPPYSDFTKFMRHSFEIADNVVYLIMMQMLWYSINRWKEFVAYGGIKTQMIVGNGNEIGMGRFGYAMCAVHFQRNYRSGMYTVFRSCESNK